MNSSESLLFRRALITMNSPFKSTLELGSLTFTNALLHISSKKSLIR